MNLYEILIPFHSNKLFLNNCIESLLATTPDNVPITIIANNEDKDEISLHFSNSRITIIKINHSLYYPLCINYGMQFIKSPNVFVIDADTYHLPGWFENIVELYERDNNIGIIGSALIEMTSNVIKDFGLGFTNYNWVQIYKGQKTSSPLIKTGSFQAVCTASCLINKIAFQEINGFSDYCNISYSDIDLCLRLADKGYKVLGCAESKVYHKGNASQRTIPLLKKDCFAMFMAKSFDKMNPDINIYLKASYMECQKKYTTVPQYIMLNFSSIINYKWYKKQLESIMDIRIVEIYEYPSLSRDEAAINLLSTVHTDIYRNHYPFIYFVDWFIALKENQLWKKLRGPNIAKDLVVDRHGTICILSELLAGNL